MLQVVQIGGRGGGNLGKIQKNSNFFFVKPSLMNYIRTLSLWTPMSMDGMEERLVLIDFPIYPTPFSCDTFSPVLTTIMKYEAELGGSFLKRIKVVPSYPCKSVEGLWVVI